MISRTFSSTETRPSLPNIPCPKALAAMAADGMTVAAKAITRMPKLADARRELLIVVWDFVNERHLGAVRERTRSA
jgi:hypothetical protein